jgi:hypothetical protein
MGHAASYCATALQRSRYNVEYASELLLEPGFLGETPDRDFGPIRPPDPDEHHFVDFGVKLRMEIIAHPDRNPAEIIEEQIAAAIERRRHFLLENDPQLDELGLQMRLDHATEIMRIMGHLTMDGVARDRARPPVPPPPPPPPEGVTPEQWTVFRRLMNRGADLTVIRELFDQADHDLDRLQAMFNY